MKVPIFAFVLWALALVGIVVGFGFMNDASTIGGYHTWKIVGIGSCIAFVGGIVWYFVKSGSGKA